MVILGRWTGRFPFHGLNRKMVFARGWAAVATTFVGAVSGDPRTQMVSETAAMESTENRVESEMPPAPRNWVFALSEKVSVRVLYPSTVEEYHPGRYVWALIFPQAPDSTRIQGVFPADSQGFQSITVLDLGRLAKSLMATLVAELG